MEFTHGMGNDLANFTVNSCFEWQLNPLIDPKYSVKIVAPFIPNAHCANCNLGCMGYETGNNAHYYDREAKKRNYVLRA